MKKNQKKAILTCVVLGLVLILIMLSVKTCSRPKIKGQAQVNLYLSHENRVIELDLEDYVVGCVAAEMPSSFEMEALKAQAICARTYAIRKLIDKKPYPHKADLSDDIETCQAYISKKEFGVRHPNNSKKLYNKVEKAVSATKGIIILDKNIPIDALYHSTCGGQTASAKETWGNDVAYLQSKPCPYCKASKFYRVEKVFSYQNFSQLNQIEVTPYAEIKVIKNKSGRSKEININKSKITSTKLRQVLGLPSSWIDVTFQKNQLTVITRGYGHGVGLCQYGANGLAKEGKDCKAILNYYYTGIKFASIY